MALRRSFAVILALLWSSHAPAQDYAATSDLRTFQIPIAVSDGFLEYAFRAAGLGAAKSLAVE